MCGFLFFSYLKILFVAVKMLQSSTMWVDSSSKLNLFCNLREERLNVKIPIKRIGGIYNYEKRVIFTKYQFLTK